MPEADTDHTPPTPTDADAPEEWPIGALEPVIFDLRASVGIMGHLINSPSEVEKDEWGKVEDDLIELTKRIHELWRQAWDKQLAERHVHEAAMAALRAEKAAPGSGGGARAGWGAVGAPAQRRDGSGHAVRRGRLSPAGMAAGRGGRAVKKPSDGGRRTPSEAASDLIILGELLQMFDQADEISDASRCMSRRSSRRGG